MFVNKKLTINIKISDAAYWRGQEEKRGHFLENVTLARLFFQIRKSFFVYFFGNPRL